jgi:hypothetical protein
MTMDLVAKEAEKYINIILHKALKKWNLENIYRKI